MTRPAISQHLAVLRAAGLVTERRAGTRRLYRARPEGLADVRAWLDTFWTTRLADLKVAAEAARRKSTAMSTHTGARTADVLEYDLHVAASPETVWRFWTRPDDLVRWMGKVATLEARPGGAFRLDYGQGDVASGQVQEADPPRRLVFTWGWENPADSTSPAAAPSR